MLVLIAVLLALNCVRDLNHSSESGSSKNIASSNSAERGASSVFESSVEAAAPPSFLQVGKVYKASGYMSPIKVLKIDNSGWIYIEAGSTQPYREWLNTNQIANIQEQ
jgi:hypothetical protein